MLEHVAEAGAFGQLMGLLQSCDVAGVNATFLNFGWFAPTPWRNEPHAHSFYEVCLAYAGEGDFDVDGSRRDVRAGDVFLARPRVEHQIRSSQDQPLGIAFWSFSVPPVSQGIWPDLDTGDPVSARTGSLPALVCALADEAASVRVERPTMLAALGAALLVETARSFAGDAALRPAPPEDRSRAVVAAMQRFLEDNLGRAQLTTADVAATVHVSPRHAERLHRAATGESLMGTLRRLRLDRARELLVRTDGTTDEIAIRCGYSGGDALAAALRRESGQGPREIRASLRH